jgi:Zn-dependent metalloprotease
MDNGALDAHWGAEKTYDFGRRTLVEIVMTIMAQSISYVHYDDNPGNSSSYDNAFWNGRAMTYGDGNNDVLTSLDVCGHEIGHAVCSNTTGCFVPKPIWSNE